MNYQAICASIEVPIYKAFSDLTPIVPVYFDNVIAIGSDPPDEYALVNITFGPTTESTIESSLDRARGAVISRIHVRKNAGGLRARQLCGVMTDVFRDLTRTKKANSGVFIRTSDISGPTFSMSEKTPHYVAKVIATWHATVLC